MIVTTKRGETNEKNKKSKWKNHWGDAITPKTLIFVFSRNASIIYDSNYKNTKYKNK